MTNQNKPQSKLAKPQEIIRVTNDAMTPQILPGDILFLERRESNNNVIYGLPYVVISKNNHIYIRRIYDGGQPYTYYDLIADNGNKYPSKSIKRDDVESIMTIVKVVRYMSERIEVI
jgi:phage repressor protein C with HTH and peptisase S24 domain